MSFYPLVPPPPPGWLTGEKKADWTLVAHRFERLLNNISLTKAQLDDGKTKHEGVVSALNSHYYGYASKDANRFLIGSWGKQTRVRPPRDVDTLFQLPVDVYHRFNTRAGNKQSQLLQEVKLVLEETYPDTDMSGDGQVVRVPFQSYAVEVLPAFALEGGGFWICNTHDGGSYQNADPVAEIDFLNNINNQVKGNLKILVRMLKRWQNHCHVPMESFWLEQLAATFIVSWPYRLEGVYFHDWMIRDFFQFVLPYRNGWVKLPNLPKQHPIGEVWFSRAQSAAKDSWEASYNDSHVWHALAANEWGKIFGDEFEHL